MTFPVRERLTQPTDVSDGRTSGGFRFGGLLRVADGNIVTGGLFRGRFLRFLCRGVRSAVFPGGDRDAAFFAGFGFDGHSGLRFGFNPLGFLVLVLCRMMGMMGMMGG